MTTTRGLLVLMGSGETTPTMVTIHQRIMDVTRDRTGSGRLRASQLDTPYGFQENAEEITAKTAAYFDHNVGQTLTHVPAARLEGLDGVAVERILESMRRSDWLFAGPGSPSYAQRQWADPRVTDAFAAVCRQGGTVVLASAAAVTAGERTIPVYEIYKAGDLPVWRDGLGLVGALTGWNCIVVPHFDNAEGQTHDTRFCYLGERRLALLEQELTEDTWILGIDEHTACTIDLEAQTLGVEGRGGVHIRRAGEERLHVPSGTTIPIEEVARAAAAAAASSPEGEEVSTTTTGPAAAAVEETTAELLQRRFEQAVQDQDGAAATAAALDAEELSRQDGAAVGVLRAMLIRLGDLAAAGMHDHTELIRPHIETLLHVREDARARKVFEVADHIRGHMDADGVRVEDTREGTRWEWDDPSP